MREYRVLFPFNNMADVRFDRVISTCVENGAIYGVSNVNLLTRFWFLLLCLIEQIARSPVEIDQRMEYFTTSVLQHIAEKYCVHLLLAVTII